MNNLTIQSIARVTSRLACQNAKLFMSSQSAAMETAIDKTIRGHRQEVLKAIADVSVKDGNAGHSKPY